jgi:hypothetical protein
MPKVEIDYSNTIVYKIACKDPLIKYVYVGHTTNFVQRKYSHKQTCNNVKSPGYNVKLYKTIRANGNWSNWDMSIVQSYNCKDHSEAMQKEQEHFNALNDTEQVPKSVDVKIPIIPISNAKLECKLCDYRCSKKSDFERHLSTIKHAQLQILYNAPPKNAAAKIFLCDCGKEYKHRQSLSVHKKTCVKKTQNTNTNTNANTNTNTNANYEMINDVVIKLINQNKELQQMLLEQNNKFFEIAKDAKCTTNNTINNNNTTNNFNLQIYLNETCKDALNLVDFVSSLKVQLKDLEETAKIGYTEGVSRIFINGLNELEVNMRPIHCSDAKRETLYIKNNDEWTKEDPDKSNITKAIKSVSNKNIKQIFEWQKKYPSYKDPESKQNDKYLEMICNAMGGSTDEEQSKNLNKIIRNITKEVIIDKNIIT